MPTTAPIAPATSYIEDEIHHTEDIVAHGEDETVHTEVAMVLIGIANAHIMHVQSTWRLYSPMPSATDHTEDARAHIAPSCPT